MSGLVPGIHVFLRSCQDVDGRDICAKTRFALQPGHDGVVRVCLREKSVLLFAAIVLVEKSFCLHRQMHLVLEGGVAAGREQRGVICDQFA
jgi:hypothetical protein